MPLRMAPLGEEVEIKRLAADEKVKRHLENLGLAVGQKVTVLVRAGRRGDSESKRRAYGVGQTNVGGDFYLNT